MSHPGQPWTAFKSSGRGGASWAPFLTYDRMLAGPVLCRWSQLQWIWEHKATSSSMLVFYPLPYLFQLVYSVYPFYNGPWAWRGHMSIMDGHSTLTLGGSQPEAFSWACDTSPEFPVVTWAHLAWRSVARYTGSTSNCWWLFSPAAWRDLHALGGLPIHQEGSFLSNSNLISVP